jgi:hypothetical protein
MLGAKGSLVGKKVVLEMWQPMFRAPLNGHKVKILYADGTKIKARWIFGAWRTWLLFPAKTEGMRNFSAG